MLRKHILAGVITVAFLLLNVTATQEDSAATPTTTRNNTTMMPNTTTESTTTTATSAENQASTGTISTSEPTTPKSTTVQTTHIPNTSTEKSTLSASPTSSASTPETTANVSTSITTTPSVSDLPTTSLNQTATLETNPTTSTMTSSVSLNSTPSQAVSTPSGTTPVPSSTSTLTAQATEPSTSTEKSTLSASPTSSASTPETTANVSTSITTTPSVSDLPTTSLNQTATLETNPTTSTMTSSVSLNSTPSQAVSTPSGTTPVPSSTSTLTAQATEPSTTATQEGSTNTDSNSSSESVTFESTLTTVAGTGTAGPQTSTISTEAKTKAATSIPTSTQTTTGNATKGMTTALVSTTTDSTTMAASTPSSGQTTTVNGTVGNTSHTSTTTAAVSTQTTIGNETTETTTSTTSTTPEIATTAVTSAATSTQTTTDTDDCNSSPCHNGGTCEDGVNDYTCRCAAGYDGKNCSNNIDDCIGNPCQNGGNCTDSVNNYTCTCVAGYGGKNCSNDIDDCADVTCMHNGTCEDKVNNFTCICVAGWEGEKCEIDIDECNTKTHDCHRNADCTNTDGSFNCSCKQGFTGDGRLCTDIDECDKDNNKCASGSTCFNTPGNYSCYCTEFWTGQHCESDINECDNSPCAENASCNNTNGGYNCSCMPGYRGNGYERCFRETLIQVTEKNPIDGDDNIVGPVEIENVIYYYGKPYNSFYVSMNGYITLGAALDQRYPPRTPEHWTHFKYPVIAPLWSDIETQGRNSNMDYRVIKTIEHLELIGKAMHTDTPSLSIIVTWKKAVPYPFNQNSKNETADFQAVISKVGFDTFVMFNYDQELFTWKTGTDRIVAVGYSMDNFTGNVTFDKDNFTNVTKKGTNDVNGRWVFNVTSSEANWVKESACLHSVHDLKPKIDNARSNIEHCPCTLSQVQRDNRFKMNKDTTYGRHYISRFKRGVDNARQKCHYSPVESLLKNYPGGGYIDVDTADQAYNSCCLISDNCAMFFNINPSDTCAEYIPPTWAPSFGDPHITTLDGARYTFNARGEFILLQLKNQQNTSVDVQIRTELANPTNADATVIVGLAVKAKNEEKVELLLDNTSQTCSIYVNGVFNTTAGNSSVNIDLTEMQLFSDEKDDKTITIAVSSGLNLIVKIRDILDIVASAPNEGEYKGNVLGLLGNNNGDKTDDYRLRNETDVSISSNSSEEDLFNFGLTWRVKENESLFTYNISDGSYEFYNNDSIKPQTFIGDLKDLKAYLNETCGDDVVNVSSCGGNKACLVDAVAMCNLTFGQRSERTENDAKKENSVLDHKPPVFSQPNPLYVGFGENSTEFIFNFSIEINTTIPENAYVGNETYFSWNNVSEYLRNTPVYLKIIGTDRLNATSEYWPDIYYCGCAKQSECDYSLIIQNGLVDGSNGKFFRAKCSCSEGMTGDYCDEVVDRCVNNVCFEGVYCNSSIPPPDSPCGPCPPGLVANASKCYDVNECYEDLDQCDQICYNTKGSYTCDCEDGYELASDGTTCRDKNECEKNPCNDTQYCENTAGSFKCLCRPGFSYFESEDKCKRETASYGGILVVETIVKNETKLKNYIKEYLISVYRRSVSKVIVTFVEIVSVEEVNTPSRRRRSDDANIRRKILFVLHTDRSYNTAEVHDVLSIELTSLSTTSDYGQVLDYPILISVTESNIYQDGQEGICAIPEKTDCDTLSTICNSANGTYECKCRTPEFEGWENPYTSCKDVDECEKSVCEGGECVNFAGGYFCNCPAGYIYENNSTCTDMCTSSPCQNDGQCIHGDVSGQYLCKCDDKWTGLNCENKNEEAERLKITAIAVGASVGAVCLLLLLAVFGMYRRQKHKFSGYRRPLSTDFDSAYGITMPSVGTKDFPIDDDTDTAFSIPRPSVNQGNGYDHLVERETHDYRRIETGDSGRLEQPQEPLTKKTTDSVEDDGIDNSSFLHSRTMEEARRSSRRISRNPYEYF